VVEHERGYRSEYAKPLELGVPLGRDTESVSRALAIRQALEPYCPAKVVDPDAGLALSDAELYRIFVGCRPGGGLRAVVGAVLRSATVASIGVLSVAAAVAIFALSWVAIFVPLASGVYISDEIGGALGGPIGLTVAAGQILGFGAAAQYLEARHGKKNTS